MKLPRGISASSDAPLRRADEHNGKPCHAVILALQGFCRGADTMVRRRCLHLSGVLSFNPNRSLEFSQYFCFILSIFSLDFLQA